MILNQLETWDGTDEWVRNAFRGEGEHVQLDEGFRIYKFNSYPTLQAPGSPEWEKITAWWSPYEPYKWDAGLENRRGVAMRMGNASLRELSRIVVAVCEDWSSLRYLVQATLTRPVYAFFGTVEPQNRFGNPVLQNRVPNSMRRWNERANHGGGRLVGLGGQFYIPNLRMAHLTDIQVTDLG
ncbi:MAG: hypothetical protein VYB65_04745 [Myxococcota bacterium]|nr:hypothetical protein [Myxococcota bacterium]